MICLIDPGGAGKSTASALVAHLLALPFLDLDRVLSTQHGDTDHLSPHAGAGPMRARRILTDDVDQ